MSYQIKKEFNPYFETLLLLCNSADFKSYKQLCIQALDKYGMSGKTVYEMHLTGLEKVIKEFGEKQIVTEDTDFFFASHEIQQEEDFPYIQFLLELVSEHFDELQTVKDEAALRQLEINILQEAVELKEVPVINDLADFLEFLETLSISGRIKWKFITIYHQPEKYFNSLVNLVKVNVPVHEEVYQENDVYKLMDKPFELLAEGAENFIAKTFDSLVIKGVVYPTFAAAFSQMGFEKNGYLGILLPEIFGDDSFIQDIDNKLLMRLKALADKSKLQILMSIKNKPKFNLELAEELSLSPGTISHHMGVLMVAELVSVEKKSGKVYYQLEEETIASILVRLKSLLFD